MVRLCRRSWGVFGLKGKNPGNVAAVIAGPKNKKVSGQVVEQPVLYLSLQETLELHEQLILRFGGSAGVRDMGLLLRPGLKSE